MRSVAVGCDGEIGLIASRRTVPSRMYCLAQRVEARRLLVGRQGVQRGDLLRRQLGAGLRVADRERALDPVDALERVQLIA